MADFFKPKCSTDEVITMLKADYGRMNIGHCIKTNHGSMPCSSNELGFFDRACSGKRTCEVLIPSPEMKISNACTTDFIRYLDASYRCQKGKCILIYLTRESCFSFVNTFVSLFLQQSAVY